MKKCIEFNGVSKKYEVGEKAFYALDDVSFSIDQHEMVVILGPSGAGKSTLLNIMGGMDHVTDGKVYMDGLDISGYSEKELTDYRAENIGFIFQFYNILPTLTVKENVDLIRDVVKNAKDSTEILNKVGLNGQENTVVIVTHNALIADVADRVIRLKNGKIIENVVNKQPKNIDEVNW